MSGKPIKELHIKRKDGKPLELHNYKGEHTKFGQYGLKIAAAFQGPHSANLHFEKGFSIVLRGTGEVVPMEDLWFDLKDPYQRRDEEPSAPNYPVDDTEIPF